MFGLGRVVFDLVKCSPMDVQLFKAVYRQAFLLVNEFSVSEFTNLCLTKYSIVRQ